MNLLIVSLLVIVSFVAPQEVSTCQEIKNMTSQTVLDREGWTYQECLKALVM